MSSATYEGWKYDLTLMPRRRGPPLPGQARLYADSGYQGLDKTHPATEIPYKKSKTRPLTADERSYNHALSRFRVRVEHANANAKLKRFRILADRYRYPRPRYAAKISIVAGILNMAAGF